ncbi:hypothetical protein [Sphingomonas sp. Leaf4]|uniref:hypothetical protein n=1 Tax=Sphingomonas sp. Leaf4 TaxID=2876553 RepID=UPI001E60A365|nr:hypothetical protein [Sphingomonas sp. Leaf4]
MADRRQAMLAQCRSAIGARRRQAEVRHADALRALDAAEAARMQAGEMLHAAERDWNGQMRARFDPLLGVLLGRELRERAEQVVRADRLARDAATARAGTEAAWRCEDGRWRMLDDAVAAARADAARRADEALLTAAADRLCFQWSAR